MRMSKLKVNHFKSLVDFEIDLAKFTCLVGLNGSGKSTVLQWVDFLAQLMRGDMKGWLKEREWEMADLAAWKDDSAPIAFAVEMADDSGKPLGKWEGSFNPRTLRCDREELDFGGTQFSVVGKTFTASHRERPYEITLEYEGSLLAKIREEFLPGPIAEFRKFFKVSRTLELLSPRLMRQRTRAAAETMGRGGERLAAYLHDLPRDRREAIGARLKHVYPHFEGIVPRSGKSGAKVLEIEEAFEGRKLKTDARHMNDGLLRILAVVANLESGAPLLVFDEIENGINPELVQFVVESISESKSQVLVTTHSPMILNYLPDAEAREGVVYMYRTREGPARSARFFSIPSMREKLKVLGPGEVFADTNLVDLAAEIAGAAEPA